MTVAANVLGLGCAALAVALMPAVAWAQSDPCRLQALAVHINHTPQQPWPGYGIYLGNGLILTAAHVAGDVRANEAPCRHRWPRPAGGACQARQPRSVDLTLLSIDGTKLPVGLQMRRTPLCEHSALRWRKGRRRHSRGNGPLEDSARQAIPADLRARFGTAIADVATTGNSGSGVFDARDLCLLGIISRKISVTRRPPMIGAPSHTTDIAKYFVPAAAIKDFIPQGVSF